MDTENEKNEEDEPKVQADHNGIAVGRISAGRDISGNIHIGDKVYQYESEEDVPLTSDEIEIGLTRLDEYLPERAPILAERFSSMAKKLRATLGPDLKSLSPTLKSQREDALDSLIAMCMEALDVSFHALCQGQNPPPYDSRPPFRGLYAFHAEDTEFYFGRETLIQKLLERLKTYPFLAVLGASGSGKSSLVMAGLIPALDAKMAYFRPFSIPLYQLHAARENADQNTVFVVDQFEELFTLTRDEKEREAFIRELLELTQKNRTVITMRADFWGEVAAHSELKQVMQEHQELIAPMDTNELNSAMEKQAGAVGLRFDATLSGSILDDVQGEPGAMPLLQQALWILWKRRHGLWLKAEEYQAFGGVKQAIASTAEEVYASCTDAERERLRDIFLRLTRLDEGGEGRDTRRRVLIRELVPAKSNPNETTQLLNKLADARLIVKTNREVEVAHEALIRHWHRLLGWLNEDRGNLHIRESISEDAREWENSGRDESLLNHRGGRLELALVMSKDPRYQLNPIEQAYLDACVEVKERARIEKEEQQRRELEAAKQLAETAQAKAKAERRGRQITIVMSVTGVILVALLIVMGYEPVRNGILRQEALQHEMVKITAGDYALGDPKAAESPDEYLPQKEYAISAFSIDVKPVTNIRYEYCVQAGVCSRPNALRVEYEAEESADEPVVNVTAIDAAEFCGWLEMRLPSEKEWAAAAGINLINLPVNQPDGIGFFYEWTRSNFNQLEPDWTDISKDPPDLLTKKGGALDQALAQIMTYRQSTLSIVSDKFTGFRCAISQ